MSLTASEKDEAERTLKLLERTIERLSSFKFPELIARESEETDEFDEYDEENEAWDQFECPWCHHVDYIESYRVVGVSVYKAPIAEPNDGDQTTFEVCYDDKDDESTDTHLECDYCHKPVSLPEKYDTEAY